MFEHYSNSLIVFYRIGFTKSTYKYWRQINKSRGGRAKLYCWFCKTNTVQYFIVYFVLIDAIKHNVEKKFKTCCSYLRDCLGEVSRKRTK